MNGAQTFPVLSVPDAAELERLLKLLAQPGAQLITGGGFERAVVMQPEVSEEPVATTATRYGAALCAIGWARKVPVPPRAKFDRIQISAGGLAAIERIRAGEEVLARREAEEPEIASAPLPRREILRREVMHLPEAERVDYLLDLIDGLTETTERADQGWMALGIRLTPAELRILAELAAKRGRVVSYAALIWALSSIAESGASEIVALRQAVARIRKKIRAAGAPIEITSSQGRGYAINAPRDFTIPGEKENEE